MSGRTAYDDPHAAILVWPTNPILEPRPQLAWPMAPIRAAIAAILHTHAARIWGPLPDPEPGWWLQWAGDPYAELRAELAGYTPDDAAVTLAGIRALAGAL